MLDQDQPCKCRLIGLSVFSESDIDVWILLVVVIEDLFAALIEKLDGEVLSEFRFFIFALPLPIVIPYFELSPFFSRFRLESNYHIIFQIAVIAFNQDAFLAVNVFAPHSAPHRHEVMSVLATRVKRKLSIVGVVKWSFTVLEACGASGMAAK